MTRPPAIWLPHPKPRADDAAGVSGALFKVDMAQPPKDAGTDADRDRTRPNQRDQVSLGWTELC